MENVGNLASICRVCPEETPDISENCHIQQGNRVDEGGSGWSELRRVSPYTGQERTHQIPQFSRALGWLRIARGPKGAWGGMRRIQNAGHDICSIWTVSISSRGQRGQADWVRHQPRPAGTENDGRPRAPFPSDVRMMYMLYSPLFNISSPEKGIGKIEKE